MVASSLSVPRFSGGPSGAIEGPIAAAGPVSRTNGGSGDVTVNSDSTADLRGGLNGARGPTITVGGPGGPMEGPTMEALVPAAASGADSRSYARAYIGPAARG